MKWKEMSTLFKGLTVISCLCLVAAAYFLLFDVGSFFASLGFWENGTNYASLLMALSGILQGVIKLKIQRVFSIFMIVAWSVLFILNLYVLIFLK